ncbi:AAA family ATPase [Scytonema hofmannii FACHB-248]|uniref:AAA family ATPase n=1 Tax=Scytonema hofmannii FACHB-248 TaxID=1842502 RepID=A0ABR8H0K0_9CYAN|nr:MULTISPECIES: AAA family ATPase [Nostocales]MBD2608963.1 AAA family ATPase [Scytonema hofmannii FACHB-248]
MIVSFTNQKGGVGKSTAAVHMTYWLNQRGSALLVDSDAQQSSSTWLKNLNLPYQVISDPEELFETLPALVQQYSAIVIDGPGSLSEVTKAILARSDLALVPCQPSGLDLHSSSKILRFIRHAQELRGGMPKAAMFLSRATKGTVLLQESREVLKGNPFPLLSTTIYQRQCLADAPGQEKTVFQMSGAAAKEAAKDYESLFKESLEVLNDRIKA